MAAGEKPVVPSHPKASEERLDAIRNEAAATGKVVTGAGRVYANAQIPGAEDYYNLPVLKPPTWTWEVPLYFFVGGIAGVSSVIAFVGHLFHADPPMVRVALWIAFVGTGLCPALLISDLGRPLRFLNMLRVFKWRSAMSMGSWILAAFGGCAFLALATNELILYGIQNPFLPPLRWVGEFTGAVTGLLLASYTGVLIGATAIPVWYENRRLIPAHFLTSGLGGSSAILELFGFLLPATQILGFAAAGIETVVGVILESRLGRVDAPLHHGKSGWTMRIAGTLEGPIALLVRILWHGSAKGRYAAAACFLLGALCSRYAWIWAGRASAHDPQALFESQHAAMTASRAARRTP
ncbi:MAG TPA: NrfD/PsrC family molybdoenzyme membrane anchor subunit [Candidatus Acidoferrales bacterium]|nr:NrfD/PsrC family molybdoenzyme membrane anchor subunit [Candidatus Acidoferrales bacterium]